MKKYFILMASAALMLAVSCNKEEVNTPATSNETELITVQINPETKTSLDGFDTIWSAEDAISVTVGGKNIGTLTYTGEGNEFSGEVEAGHIGDAILNYPAGVTEVPAEQAAVAGSFAEGAALLEGTTTMDALRAGEGVILNNTTALLKFTAPIAGNVAFTIGSKAYTVEDCEAGKTYYACVDPANSGKLSYTVGIVLGAKEKATFAPVANEIYNLGTLTLKESMFGVTGDNNNWAGDAMMYETSVDNLFVAFDVTFASAGGFKVRKAGGWDDNYNFGTTSNDTKSANSTVGVYTDGGSGNIKVAASTYDIYFNRLKGQVYIMTSGKSYTEATAPSTASDKYSLIGTIEGSNWDKDFYMEYSGDNIWTSVATFEANNEWKVRKNSGWDSSWGYDNVNPGSDKASNSGGNVKMKTAGTYVVGFVLSKNKITLVVK